MLIVSSRTDLSEKINEVKGSGEGQQLLCARLVRSESARETAAKHFWRKATLSAQREIYMGRHKKW